MPSVTYREAIRAAYPCYAHFRKYKEWAMDKTEGGVTKEEYDQIEREYFQLEAAARAQWTLVDDMFDVCTSVYDLKAMFEVRN